MSTEAGWYHAEGDPTGTVRYWDGAQWVGQAIAAPTPYVEDDSSVALASPWSRVGARFIDLILAFLVSFIIYAPLVGQIGEFVGGQGAELERIASITDKAERDAESAKWNDFLQKETAKMIEDAMNPGRSFAVAAVVLLSEIGLVALYGATPGKFLFRLRVADRQTSVTPPGVKRAFYRGANRLLTTLAILVPTIYLVVSNLVFAVAFISLIMLFVTSENRTVMDRIAGTVVIRKAKD